MKDEKAGKTQVAQECPETLELMPPPDPLVSGDQAAKEPAQPVDGAPRTRATAAGRVLAVVEEQARAYHKGFDGQRYLRLGRDGRTDVVALGSERMYGSLSHAYYEQYGEVLSQSAIKNTLPVLGSRCDATDPVNVFLRMGAAHDRVYIDHHCSGEMALVVGDGSVKEEQLPDDVLFRRTQHMRPYGDIDFEAKPTDIWEFLNVVNAPRDNDSQLLLLVWLVTGFIPGLPRPILLLTGPQGTAKTTMFRYLRSIIDPSDLQNLALPKDSRNLGVTLNSNYLVPFDNVSSLGRLADPLCRAVTGESVVERKYYTNSEIVAFGYQRLLALNGIDIDVGQPDLLDRVLSISLLDIGSGKRRLQSDTDAQFELILPRTIGAALNTAAGVIGRALPRPGKLPRMADWASYGAEIAAALGMASDRFLDAYEANIGGNREASLQSRPFAWIVRRLAERNARPEWRVSPRDLLRSAEDEAKQSGLPKGKDVAWPSHFLEVMGRLRQSETDLRHFGIEFIEETPGSDAGGIVRFTNLHWVGPQPGTSDSRTRSAEMASVPREHWSVQRVKVSVTYLPTTPEPAAQRG